MTGRPKNAWVCKVLPTHWIPAESHVSLKSFTMTESLSYGRLPLMQVRAYINIKNDSLHVIKLTTSSYLSSLLRAIDDARGKMTTKSWSFGTFTTCYRKNRWGKGSMSNIHYHPVITFLILLVLERIFSTDIFFCESELTFVTLISRMKNCSLSTCCSCGSTSMSLCTYVIDLLQNRGCYYVSLSWNLPFYNWEHGLHWIFGHMGSLRVSYVTVCCNTGLGDHGTLLWLK